MRMDSEGVTKPMAMPKVQVFLSRPAYPLGSVLVGTVLIQPSDTTTTTDPATATSSLSGATSTAAASEKSLRSLLKSVVVYVAGFCRIDSRWHNVAEYIKIYGTTHPFLQSLNFDADLLAPPAKDETVCFWATQGLDLLTMPERRTSRKYNMNGNPGTDGSTSSSSPFLAFTFRVEIPIDLPHSVHASTCRYHYTVDVLIKTATQERAIKTPFEVTTNPCKTLRIPKYQQRNNSSRHANNTNSNGNDKIVISGARVKFGNIIGLAHSNGWPCHLSTSEINQPKGQMTVARRRYHQLEDDVQRDHGQDIQTLRVANAQGRPVCMLTVIGASKIIPGSQIHLQWDFGSSQHDSNGDGMENDWIPCHQIAACLSGDEWAIYEDGKSVRTKNFMFDTCHEWIDPGVTQCVSKSLNLSMESPYTLFTDIMELCVRCQVDITIMENGAYNNLRLEFPCHVVKSLHQNNATLSGTSKGEDERVLSLSELLGKSQNANFPVDDIMLDLKSLSLQMEQKLSSCNDE